MRNNNSYVIWCLLGCLLTFLLFTYLLFYFLHFYIHIGKIKEATHALVIMLGGIFTRWKVPAAYYFTPDDVNGTTLKPIIEEIIRKAESIGLLVHSVTSDMGPVNLSMWKAFGGIVSGKYTKIRNSIVHPVDNKRKLMFIADAPHLYKNLKASLLNNKVMELPTTFVQTYNLSQPIVKYEHLNELIDIQENLQFKLIPKLRKQDITCTTFNKMKVNKAKNVLSRDVSSAIKFYAEEKGKPDFNTTAAFIEIMAKWFTLVTARTPKVALGKTNKEKTETKYNDSIVFLESIIELFRDIKIGYKRIFKPVQNGIIITTSSIIELSNYLINERNYQYVLAGRFTQDCVENLFSSIRVKHPTPNALQFQQNLKLLVISQYLKLSQTASYDKDDGRIICDFLNYPKKKASETKAVEQCTAITLSPKDNIHIDNIELNILYNIAGYIIVSIIKCNKTCAKCLDSVGSKQYDPYQKYTKFVQLRCFRKNALFFVNHETFEYFYNMEIVIRQYIFYFKNITCNFLSFYMDKMKDIVCHRIQCCHQLPKTIMKRFILYRMRISCKKRDIKKKIYSSKTMAMHSIVK